MLHVTISELSEIKPDEESRKLKPSVSKQKQKVIGQHSEGGPSVKDARPTQTYSFLPASDVAGLAWPESPGLGLA